MGFEVTSMFSFLNLSRGQIIDSLTCVELAPTRIWRFTCRARSMGRLFGISNSTDLLGQPNSLNYPDFRSLEIPEKHLAVEVWPHCLVVSLPESDHGRRNRKPPNDVGKLSACAAGIEHVQLLLLP